MQTRLILALTISCLMLVSVVAEDYYQLLGITQQASESEIKKAYKKMSLKFHPDKNPGDEAAAEKYVQINKAYEILNNPEKRRIYDTQGVEGLEGNGRGHDPWGRRNKGPDAHSDISVSLEDLYNGAHRSLSMKKNVICDSCRGTGAKDGKTKTCPHCGGHGVRLEKTQVGPGMFMQMQTTCNRCGGRGKTFASQCPKCGGRKVVQGQQTLEVDIEKGMRHQQKIIFEKQSEQNPDWTPGDVIFILKQQAHPRFKRIGDNLYHDTQLTMKDAILGFKRTVKHLDSHYTEISSNEVIQPFQVKVIKKEGMPIHGDSSSFGDMHVKHIVKLPKVLTQKDKDLVEKIFSLSS